MVDDPRPIDGNLWGQWVRAGSDRWEVVRRSWSVFVRNTTELIDLLKIPGTNMAVSYGSVVIIKLVSYLGGREDRPPMVALGGDRYRPSRTDLVWNGIHGRFCRSWSHPHMASSWGLLCLRRRSHPYDSFVRSSDRTL